MLIHVVQKGDTIESIANSYGVPAARLIIDNGLNNPTDLVVGQCIVIAYPELTYTVKEGDTLLSIANSFQVSLMQLYTNNPYLNDRTYIFPGETIVIQYKTKGKITTHGNTVPYIDIGILRKTLPYLTYLSILNFTATKEGNIITYYDDTEIIQIAKDYGVMPLMLLTTLSIQGEANIGIAYDILLNNEFQDRQIDNIITILKARGYYGVNISFEYISISNTKLYEDYINKITYRLNQEGFLVFTTINTNIHTVNNELIFEKIDYSNIDKVSNNIIFMNYQWATTISPPSPISSIFNMNLFINYINQYISSSKIIIGLATIGYDWELPFSAGLSTVTPLTLNRAIDFAREVEAVIQFDELSQTPFYTYEIIDNNEKVAHIVWFIDVRSINALLDLLAKYQLQGTGIWNITIYNTQLWLTIYTQYEIAKVL